VVVALVVAIVPLSALLGRVLLKAYQKTWDLLGRPDIGAIDAQRRFDVVETITTGYGPVALAVGAAALVLTAAAVRSGRLPKIAIVVAASPFVWLALVGVAVAYFPYNARFAMSGYALGAASWGLLLRHRPIAWSAVAVAGVTLLLCAVHYEHREAGIRLLQPARHPSAFTRSRGEALAVSQGIGPISVFVDERIPTAAVIATWPYRVPGIEGQPQADLLTYLLFGPRREHDVVYAETPAAAARAGAGWFAVPTGLIPAGCLEGWSRALESSGWTVLRRSRSSC
jgi:hypothetical protein